MPTLTWGESGTRLFETGVDKVVLFPPSGVGVPWSGVTEIKTSSNGGEPTPYYIDGYKYAAVASVEEFEATISAFYAPDEFLECDGVVDIQNGLFITNQPRTTFGLSFRTKLGNDTAGANHSYKLHLVYGCLAEPTDRAYSSLNNDPKAEVLSWNLSTVAPLISGYRPTAHYLVDASKTPSGVLADLEDLLYGTIDTFSSLPNTAELIALFTGP
jgi:hypothetical protein